MHPAHYRPKPLKLGGMYPASGVAPGGQQGRPQFAHNGLPGVRPGGGATVGGSRPRPGAPRPQRPMPGGFKPADFQQLLAALMSTSGLRR